MAFHLMVVGGFIPEDIPDGSAAKPPTVVEGATAVQEAPKGLGLGELGDGPVGMVGSNVGAVSCGPCAAKASCLS